MSYMLAFFSFATLLASRTAILFIYYDHAHDPVQTPAILKMYYETLVRNRSLRVKRLKLNKIRFRFLFNKPTYISTDLHKALFPKRIMVLLVLPLSRAIITSPPVLSYSHVSIFKHQVTTLKNMKRLLMMIYAGVNRHWGRVYKLSHKMSDWKAGFRALPQQLF